MLVRRVDENSLARCKAANDEHVVVVGTNDEFVDLDICIRPMKCAHFLILAASASSEATE